MHNRTAFVDRPFSDLDAVSRARWAASVIELQASLTAQSQMVGGTNRYGEARTELRWKLDDHDLRIAARWLDEVFETQEREESRASLSRLLTFRWRELASGNDAKCGGMFGYHLSKPRAITTMFAFEPMDHYEGIKEYLSRSGLVELSDKRLKAAQPSRRRNEP